MNEDDNGGSQAAVARGDQNPNSLMPTDAIRIYILDDNGQRIPVNTPYRLTVGDQVRAGRLSEKGLVEETGLVMAATGTIEWDVFQPQPPNLDPDDSYLLKRVQSNQSDDPFLFGTTPVNPKDGIYAYRAQITLNTDHADAADEQLARTRLLNMGYPANLVLSDHLIMLQGDYQLGDSPADQLKESLRDAHRDGTEMPLVQPTTPDPEPGPLDDDGFPMKQCPKSSDDSDPTQDTQNQ